MEFGGRTVLAEVGPDGEARMKQLLSTDPQDFLDPAFTPGVRIGRGPA